ncbi:hypothetical protein Pelo_5671 [Pelomyxa schiedti]|nr:hypothetical protein Pelo_5671 [Pelomyxa schiedti]
MASSEQQRRASEWVSWLAQRGGGASHGGGGTATTAIRLAANDRTWAVCRSIMGGPYHGRGRRGPEQGQQVPGTRGCVGDAGAAPGGHPEARAEEASEAPQVAQARARVQSLRRAVQVTRSKMDDLMSNHLRHEENVFAARERDDYTRCRAELFDAYANASKESASVVQQVRTRLTAILRQLLPDSAQPVSPFNESLQMISSKLNGIASYLNSEVVHSPSAKQLCATYAEEIVSSMPISTALRICTILAEEQSKDPYLARWKSLTASQPSPTTHTANEYLQCQSKQLQRSQQRREEELYTSILNTDISLQLSILSNQTACKIPEPPKEQLPVYVVDRATLAALTSATATAKTFITTLSDMFSPSQRQSVEQSLLHLDHALSAVSFSRSGKSHRTSQVAAACLRMCLPAPTGRLCVHSEQCLNTLREASKTIQSAIQACQAVNCTKSGVSASIENSIFWAAHFPRNPSPYDCTFQLPTVKFSIPPLRTTLHSSSCLSDFNRAIWSEQLYYATKDTHEMNKIAAEELQIKQEQEWLLQQQLGSGLSNSAIANTIAQARSVCSSVEKNNQHLQRTLLPKIHAAHARTLKAIDFAKSEVSKAAGDYATQPAFRE